MQNNPPNKKPIYQQWWCWVLAVEAVAIIGLAVGLITSLRGHNKTTIASTNQNPTSSSGSSLSNTPVTNDTNTNSANGSDNQPNSSNAKHYQVGDEVKNNESTYTVTDFVRNLDPGLTLSDVGADQELVKVGIEITNDTKKSIYITDSDFDLVDANDNKYDAATAYGADDMWHNTDLMSGESASGYIYYIVPKGQDLVLCYKPFSADNGTYVDLQN